MSITIENLQVDDLHANPHNPRKQVGDVEELASSIRSQGIKQPLLVTPTGETDIGGHKQYRVVIGHRRLAAARQAGLSTVPAIVEEMDARREREIMLVENTQRSDLTPVEEADKALAKAGVKVESFPDGKNYWTFEPRGYRRHNIISSTRDPFWKQFTGEDGWPEFCVFKNHGDYCLYEPIPLDQLEWAESAKAERQAIMARGKELDRKARDFEAIARDTRFAWLKTNLHTLTREQTVAGICELALAETVGWHSMFVGQHLHGEGVVEALIGFGWNLPITEHDGDHWSLECKENLDQIRMVLRDRPLRILDVLAARQEDNADWRAWRTMRGVDEMCVWYGALEHLGYQPSAEEREALKGAMVEKEQES